MRRLLALMAFGVTLSVVGYVSAEPAAKDAGVVKPVINCSTCGAEFTSSAGIEEHVKSHPGHMMMKSDNEGNLVKCSTCGVEFTSKAGVVDVYRPGIAGASEKPIILCSTCSSYERR